MVKKKNISMSHHLAWCENPVNHRINQPVQQVQALDFSSLSSLKGLASLLVVQAEAKGTVGNIEEAIAQANGFKL